MINRLFSVNRVCIEVLSHTRTFETFFAFSVVHHDVATNFYEIEVFPDKVTNIHDSLGIIQIDVPNRHVAYHIVACSSNDNDYDYIGVMHIDDNGYLIDDITGEVVATV